MEPIEPQKFWIYYAAATVVALILLLRPRRRRGMRLRMQLGRGRAAASGARHGETASLEGAQPLDARTSGDVTVVERSLNVVFNYNGHSWDAFEVLGLPAGSSLERVEAAYLESLARVDETSRPFIEAARRAILEQGPSYKVSGKVSGS